MSINEYNDKYYIESIHIFTWITLQLLRNIRTWSVIKSLQVNIHTRTISYYIRKPKPKHTNCFLIVYMETVTLRTILTSFSSVPSTNEANDNCNNYSHKERHNYSHANRQSSNHCCVRDDV